MCIRDRLRTFVTVARLAGPPAGLAIVATLALIVALATLRGARTVAVNAWLLSIGALILWTCWRVLTAALPATADSAFNSVRSRPAEQPTTCLLYTSPSPRDRTRSRM